ncbi:MAG: hypothetical protein HKN21_10330 [Candidatus Eisenbacteria bacterium]|uniref:Uncharacterized protein n=1 Tax=Eiseniibacteriota bacterium TaxID=2212470 RepID=A0A7Y2H2L8_UNCEI|nr:hypothetical protein [Candidatus Eisenbacteria bacterium]
MMNLELVLGDLFEEVGEAHHAAFIKDDGADPEWPIWYAEYLLGKINEAMGSTLTKSELVYLIISAENERTTLAPGSVWTEFYARFMAERYS